MSVNAIGNNPNSYAPAKQAQEPKPPEEKEYVEVTTVTTHCDEDHWHDRGCPHSTYTRREPKDGQYGAALDMYL